MQRIKQGLGLLGLLLGLGHAVWAVGISSTTHASVYESFDHDTGTFVQYQQPGGDASGVDLQTVDGALQMTNTHAGSFGVDAKVSPFDALKEGDLFFDYKLTPDVKVNLFFHINSNYYGVIFSGPDEVRPGTVRLGKIADVVADGHWHRAHVPLRQWLQGVEPLTSAFKVDGVIIGNWDNSEWLMAGIGGNPTGAKWWMDNWTLAATGADQAHFSLTGDDGKPLAEPQKYFWSLDDGPASALNASELDLVVKSGFHLLKISDAGNQTVGEEGFYASTEAPQTGPATLHNNDFIFPITASAGVDSSKISLQVDGNTYDFKNPALHWNDDATAIVLDAAGAGLHWKDGAPVAVQLSGVSDFLGRAAPPLKSTFTVDYKTFTAIPPAPTLENLQMGLGSAESEGFENSMEGWQSSGADGAIVERDTGNAASGYASLRLTCPANAAPFTAWVRLQPFDAAKIPYLEFDYRVSSQLRVDLLLDVNGQNYCIGFTDHTPGYPRLGQIDGIKTDLEWHHATVPLLAMLQNTLPTAAKYQVNSVAFGDTGWLGNAAGEHYWIDNFHFVPDVNGNNFQTNVQLRDITGINALSWKLFPNAPAGIAPDVPRTAQTSGSLLALKGDGLQQLGLRAQDGAGNWSPAAQLLLALDNQSPILASPALAVGVHAAPTQVQWPLKDNLSLDLGSVQLSVLGHTYTITDPALTYDAKNEKLTWDLLAAQREGILQPMKNGQTVDWQLQPVQDAAGNKSASLQSTFTFDYALQKSLPELTVDSATHPRLLFDNFDDGNVPWKALNGSSVVSEKRPPGTGNQALKITDTSGDNNFYVRISTGRWDPKKYNLLSFDYKIPPGTNVGLRLHVGNRNVLLKLCGDAIKSNLEIPGIVTDNQWHNAVFNLLSLPEKLMDDKIIFVDLVDPSGKTPVKTEMEFDNWLIQSGSSNAVALSWKALDLSGITGYHFAWDQNPYTIPTQNQVDDHITVTGTSGLWFAHIQARNGAGLWSDTIHYPVLIP